MKLCGNSVDPNAAGRMNIAIADFLHSHCLPFSLATDPKLAKIIEIGRTLGPHYKPPHRDNISGKYLNALYSTYWTEQMRTLMSEARVFGLTLFGDGATIKTVPLVNVLAAGINNPFALLDIADCTDHLAKGGKKDAQYIAKICMPLIKQIESEVLDVNGKKSPGVIDLVFFDGASNVQNAGQILKAYNRRITVGHGAEHVVSLFFLTYTQRFLNSNDSQILLRRFAIFLDLCVTARPPCLRNTAVPTTTGSTSDSSSHRNAEWRVNTLPY